jgi:hypothetical protein
VGGRDGSGFEAREHGTMRASTTRKHAQPPRRRGGGANATASFQGSESRKRGNAVQPRS